MNSFLVQGCSSKIDISRKLECENLDDVIDE